MNVTIQVRGVNKTIRGLTRGQVIMIENIVAALSPNTFYSDCEHPYDFCNLCENRA